MGKEKSTVVFGPCEEELSLRINQIPLSGETTVERGGRERVLSGSGLLAAAQAALLSPGVTLCSALGSDSAGAEIKRLAQARGFASPYLYTDGAHKTALRLTLREKSGAARTMRYPGAIDAFKLEFAEEAMRTRPDAVLMTTAVPETTLSYVAEEAERAGSLLFLSSEQLRNGSLLSAVPRCAAFILSEAEAGFMTRILPDTLDNCLLCAMKLTAAVRADYYIIRLRERGYFIYDGKYRNLVPPTEITVKDVRGSAEAFLAALSCAYLSSGDMETAVSFAAVASAICASREGTLSSLPTLKEIKSFCEKNDID